MPGISLPPISPVILASSAVAVPRTGSTAEVVLATFTLPGGTLGLNGALRLSSAWSMTNSANAKTIRARLGGLGGTLLMSAALTTVAASAFLSWHQNRNAQNSQYNRGEASRGTDGLRTDLTPAATAVDTSANQDFVITAQLALGTETMTLEQWCLELLRK